MLRLTRRLYLNSDKSKVVEHGDPDAAFLIGTKGALISEEDAKRLGVSDTEKHDGPVNTLFRHPAAYVPSDPADDSVYDDQSEAGKAARKMAREQAEGGVYGYVKSTGGSDEDAERAAKEATGEAAIQGPSTEEMQRERDALVGKVKK
jgi:hypothetical protein